MLGWMLLIIFEYNDWSRIQKGVHVPRTKTTSIALKLSSKEWEIIPRLFVDIEDKEGEYVRWR